jgi:hypothetical protein
LEEARGEGRKDRLKTTRDLLGLAYVPLGRLKICVTRARHDLEGVVSAYGHPRDAARSEVVKGDGLARGIVREQLGAADTRTPEVGP